MNVVTFEGIVEDGRIRLKADVRLPDKTKVYVLVPDMQVEEVARIISPRLAHRKDVADFVMEVAEEPLDVGV
jgi:nitrogen regulatory protein PII